jgi:hypothetical protein
LPLAIAGGWLAGLMVPLAGMRDAAGLVLSVFTCLLGSAAGTAGGIWLSRRIEASRPARGPTRPPPLTARPKVGLRTSEGGLDPDPPPKVD